MRKKLAIISTHPIQYYAPVFQLLAKQLKLKVFYTWGEQSLHKYDQGFKQHIVWDIPLLEGYDYTFLMNTAKDPGTHHFKGIINPGLVDAIQDFAPDAILIYGWAWQSHLKALRHFKGKIPVYFRGDSTLLDQQNGLKHLLRKLFLRWVYSHVDYAFYVGTANKAYFRYFGLKERQLIFAPHAIDNARFELSASEEAKALRENLGVGINDILILFAGKLESKKAPLFLLHAFQQLNNPNLHLLFVGNGQLEQTLKDTVKANTINNVHFMDFQNQTQMPSIYQCADLFCLPSQGPGETWGLAVNEALASGLAVLVSDKVGCATDLVDSTVGDCFKSGDIGDIKQKLIALTAQKQTLASMGQNAKQKIQEWSFEHQAQAIVEYVSR
ncbi:glycosyltransferase family 4 protein [Pedobacter sp. KR3-3]|uniref:Glycosyltransferase family 4 protein n=1 Tax=Pedobacter albus TaxID=3113905 RepID=A0ABU7I6Q5_9SPHI|nr:glycosyltransferase family 4 protein [Pedobacter sp. KR3-3]MEE1945153.1 glycosyltransferase family 4 protein [Pedobacter sp. KR3-3]